MAILSRKTNPAPAEPPVPFAPLERRQGQAYAEATQYVADLQSEVAILKTENAEQLSRISLLEGANERLHEENERIVAQSKESLDSLMRRYEGMIAENASIHKGVEIVAKIFIDIIGHKTTPDRDAAIREVEQALGAIFDSGSAASSSEEINQRSERP